jgi:ferredoxin-nitrite reductase
MGSGGFTIASHLNVFVEIYQAAAVVMKLIKIFRDHGPREARSKCRFAFLIEKWGIPRLRAELTSRMGYELAFQGRDVRSSHHADHIGLTSQKQAGLVAVGLCVPTGRVNPEQLDELARLADKYGNGAIRLTTGQNAIIPNVPADRVTKLFSEPLLRQFSPRPSPFMRGLVACVGTDYCNLALIETKGRAVALSQALLEKMGASAKPSQFIGPAAPLDVAIMKLRILVFAGSRQKSTESSSMRWQSTQKVGRAPTRLPARRFWQQWRAMNRFRM